MTNAPAGVTPSTENLVTPGESLRRGLRITGIVGLIIGLMFGVPGAILISPWVGAILFVGIGGYFNRALLMEGLSPSNNVAIGHEAPATSVGDQPTGEILGPGTHFRIPELEGAMPVDMRTKLLDPPVFTELAGDNLEVKVDGYFYRKVTDSTLSLTAAKDADEGLMKDFRSNARYFVNQIAKSEYAIQLKDEYADWLILPPLSPATTAQHADVRKKLEANLALYKNGQESVDAIMEKAGEFVHQADEWGSTIPEAHIEYFDEPESRKTAALEKANADDKAAAQRTANTAAANMTKELVAAGVDPNNAANLVAMRQGLPINKTVDEHHIGFQNLDPNAAIRDVIKPVVDAIAERIKPQTPPTP